MFSFFPYTFTVVVISVNYPANTVLHSIFPVALIFLAVWICICSETMFFIFFVVTFIFSAILPNILPITMHHTFRKLSLKLAAISPLEGTLATHLIMLPFTTIPWAISPEIDSKSLFNSICKKTVIVASITPDFYTFSILFIILTSCPIAARRLHHQGFLTFQIPLPKYA